MKRATMIFYFILNWMKVRQKFVFSLALHSMDQSLNSKNMKFQNSTLDLKEQNPHLFFTRFNQSRNKDRLNRACLCSRIIEAYAVTYYRVNANGIDRRITFLAPEEKISLAMSKTLVQRFQNVTLP